MKMQRHNPSAGVDPRKLGCDCDSCPLKGQKAVLPTRKTTSKLVILGESPGRHEEYEGRPFVGATGAFLDECLDELGIARGHLHITNTLLCRPVKGMGPKQIKQAIKCCRPRLLKELKATRARFIFGAGKMALQAITERAKIGMWIGAPLQGVKGFERFQILPALHPTFCKFYKPPYQPVFKIHLQRAWAFANKRLKPWKWPKILIQPDEEMVHGLQYILRTNTPLGIDVETLGIDPMLSKLTCIGIANKDISISVPWPLDGLRNGEELEGLVRNILSSPMPKTMQNGQHDMLTLKHNALKVENFDFDTLLAHATVAPQVPHDLGFMAALEFHAPRWKSEFGVETDAKGNQKWKQSEALRTYNAKDAWMTLLLREPLLNRLATTYRGASLFQSLMEQQVWAMRMRERGVQVDSTKFERHRVALRGRRKDALADLRRIARMVGIQDFNPNSNRQIKQLFFECLHVIPTRWSDKTEQPKLDNKALEPLVTSSNITVAQATRALLRFRRWSKLLSTYIEKLPVKKKHGKLYVRPTWKVYGTVTGRWSSSAPNCFSGDTEVLTPDGWTRLDEVHQTTPVMQYNDGLLEFVRPSTLYKLQYEGELIHIENQHIDLNVTPDHRCLLYTRRNEATVVPAADYKADRKQLHSGYFDGTRNNYPIEWIRLLVAVQADGHITKEGAIDFCFKKHRKANALTTLAMCANIEYRDYSNNKRFRYLLPKDAAFVLWCKEKLGPEKLFGSWVLRLTERLRKAFLEEAFFWDASFARQTMYASKHKINASWVATLCSLQRERAKIRRYVNQAGAVSWQVDRTKRDYSWTTNVTKTPTPHKGLVHCLTVPSSFVLVRRNGKTAITGQCQNIPKPKMETLKNGKRVVKAPGLRDIFVARDGSWIVEADFAQLELRIIALLAGDEPLIKAFAANADVHTLNARSLFEKAEITEQERDLSKRMVYGYNYGAEAETVWRSLVVDYPMLTLGQVERSQARWFRDHPAIKRWQQKQLEQARIKGYVEGPISGRREYFFGFVEPAKAFNYPVQTTAADIINPGFLAVANALRWPAEGVLFQVHDSLVLEGPDPTRLARLLKKHMERDVVLDGKKVKFPIDIKMGRSWSPLEKVKNLEDIKQVVEAA